MLHLAVKAFGPAPVPFPLLHVDTGHNFPEVLAFRDALVAAATACGSTSPSVQDYIDDGRLRERPDGTRNPLQTVPLLDAIDDAPLRRRLRRRPPRRGEGARQGADLLAARRVRPVGPAPPAPRAVEPLQRPARARRARARVPALQLDRARRLAVHRAREHRAARRSTSPTSARCSAATACGWPRAPGAAPRDGEEVERGPCATARSATCRCTGAVESQARHRRRRHRRGRRVAGSPSAAPPAPTTGCRRPPWKTASARGTSDGPGICCGFATAGSRRRRQVHPGRPAAARHQVGPRRPARGRRAARRRPRPAHAATSRCSPTACAPSASRASRSTSPTATSPRRRASSSSPTPRATCSTRATWSPAPPPPSWPCCWSTRATAWSSRPAGTSRCSRCCGVPHVVARGQQDGPGRLRRGRLRPRSPRSSPGCARSPRHRRRRRRAIPVSALLGDNVVDRSAADALVRRPDPARVPGDGAGDGPGGRTRRSGCPCSTSSAAARRAPRLPRLRGPDRRGPVAPGDEVVVLPCGTPTTVTGIDTADGPLDEAAAGRSVAIRLADDIDISRGDVIAAAGALPTVTPRSTPRCAGSRTSRCAPAPGCCSSTAPAPRR